MLDRNPSVDGLGNATFVCCPLLISMTDGKTQDAVLSVYHLPWKEQFCFWLDPKVDRNTCLTHLEEGFHQTGGVPHYLFVRAVRPFGRRLQDEIRWLRVFERFCTHHGCRPQPWLRPLTPVPHWLKSARTNVDAHDWHSLEDCRQNLDRLASQLGVSREASPAQNLSVGTRERARPNPPRGTLGGTTTSVLNASQALLPLPSTGFQSNHDTECRVGADGFIRFGGDYYSVPSTHAGRTLWTRKSADAVTIYTADEKLIAQHRSGSGDGTIRLRLSHFTFSRSPDLGPLLQAFSTCFPGEHEFLNCLLAQRKLGASQTLRVILGLTKTIRRNRFQPVFQECQRCNNYSHHFIQGLLQSTREIYSIAADDLKAEQQTLQALRDSLQERLF